MYIDCFMAISQLVTQQLFTAGIQLTHWFTGYDWVTEIRTNLWS